MSSRVVSKVANRLLVVELIVMLTVISNGDCQVLTTIHGVPALELVPRKTPAVGAELNVTLVRLKKSWTVVLVTPAAQEPRMVSDMGLRPLLASPVKVISMLSLAIDEVQTTMRRPVSRFVATEPDDVVIAAVAPLV
jgi:hypothetical protein